MPSVYETVLERIESFPGLFKSRTAVLLDALVSGKPSWVWVDGEAVWLCPGEWIPPIEDYVHSAHNSMLGFLPLMPGVPREAVDTVTMRVKERLYASQAVAPFTAQITDPNAKVPYREETFARSLFMNQPTNLTSDWAEAIEEVADILKSRGII